MTNSSLSPAAVAPAPPAGPGLAARLIRGSGGRIVAQVMPLFANLALTPFVIVTLGREGYGLWLVISTLTVVIASFDGGIGRSAQYFFSMLAGTDDSPQITRLLVTLSVAVLVLSATLVVPAFFIAESLAQFFQAPPELVQDTVFVLRVLLVLVAVGLLRNLFAAVLHGYERFGLSSLSALISYAVYAAGLVWALSAGLGLRGVAYALVAQHAVATVMIVPASLRHLTRRGIGFVPWSRVLEVGRVSWRVQISGLLSIASMQSPLLIVARLTPAQVPDFGPGATFAQQLRLIPMNAVAPIQAMLGRSVGEVGAKAARADMKHLQQMWVRAVTGWCAVGAPAAYVGVNVWLPLDDPMVGAVAAVLLIAQWLLLLPQVVLQWQLLQGRAEYEMWSSALTATLLLGTAVLLVPQVGAMGAAVAAVVGHLGGVILLLTVGRSLPVAAPSVLAEIPWLQALLSGGLSTVLVWGTGRLIYDGHLPDGGLGLLLCGAAAAPALALFVVTTWGPQRIWRRVRGRASRRK